MCSQTNTLPFNNVDGVKFRALIKTNLLLENGEKTVMLTFVPENLSFDDAMAGVNKGAKFSGRVKKIQHEIFSLINGKAKPFALSQICDLSEK